MRTEFTVTTVSEKKAYRINTRYYGKRLGEATGALLLGLVTLPLFFTGILYAVSLWELGTGLGGWSDFFVSLFRAQLVVQSHAFRSDETFS